MPTFEKLNFSKEHILNWESCTIKDFLTREEKTFQVRTYLPVSDKIDLVQTALQKAEEDGIYNEIKLDIYFHLNIIYLYTDIEFSEEDREDEMKLYDILETNDVFSEVISLIIDEYEALKNYLETIKWNTLEYKNTAAAVLRGIVQDLPKNAAAAKEIVDSFNPEQYQEVINFATAANGGRNINSQTVPISPAASESSSADKEPPSKVVPLTPPAKKD